LGEILASRTELRSIAAEEVPDEPPAAAPHARREERSAAQLKRDANVALEQGGAVIRDSIRLRNQSKRIREALRGGGTGRVPTPDHVLSKREQQVLELIVAGKSSKQIAAQLGISFKTAVTHRASIMSKLDVHEIA